MCLILVVIGYLCRAAVRARQCVIEYHFPGWPAVCSSTSVDPGLLFVSRAGTRTPTRWTVIIPSFLQFLVDALTTIPYVDWLGAPGADGGSSPGNVGGSYATFCPGRFEIGEGPLKSVLVMFLGYSVVIELKGEQPDGNSVFFHYFRRLRRLE